MEIAVFRPNYRYIPLRMCLSEDFRASTVEKAAVFLPSKCRGAFHKRCRWQACTGAPVATGRTASSKKTEGFRRFGITVPRLRLELMKRYDALTCLSLLLALPMAANTVRIYQTNSAGDAVDIIDPVCLINIGAIPPVRSKSSTAVISPARASAYGGCGKSALWQRSP